MKEGSEMAPAIGISNIQMSIDKAESDITVDGFFLSGLADKVLQIYKEDIFDKIIDKSEQYIQTTLVEKINKEIDEHGTHFDLGDGIGFDYSLTRVPEVTDDFMLSFFLNGTFFDEKAQAGLSEIPEIEHDLFEVGSNGEQDLMIHMPQSVF